MAALDGRGLTPRLKQKFGDQAPAAFQLATSPQSGSGSAMGGMGAPGTIGDTSYQQANLIRNMQRKMQSEKFRTVMAAKENYLRQHSLGNESKLFPMYMPDAKGPQVDTANQNVINILNAWKEVNKDADIDVSDYTSAFAGEGKEKDKYSVNIGVDRSGSQDKYTLELYDAETQVQSIPISEREAKQIRPDLKLAPRVSRANQRVQQSPGGNTTNSITSNLQDQKAYTGAIVKQNYFINKYNRTDILGADTKINKMGDVNLYFYKRDANNNVTAIPIKRSTSVYPEPFKSHDDALDFLETYLNTSGQIDNFIRNTK
jgi:hypothetical protein